MCELRQHTDVPQTKEVWWAWCVTQQRYNLRLLCCRLQYWRGPSLNGFWPAEWCTYSHHLPPWQRTSLPQLQVLALYCSPSCCWPQLLARLTACIKNELFLKINVVHINLYTHSFCSTSFTEVYMGWPIFSQLTHLKKGRTARSARRVPLPTWSSVFTPLYSNISQVHMLHVCMYVYTYSIYECVCVCTLKECYLWRCTNHKVLICPCFIAPRNP